METQRCCSPVKSVNRIQGSENLFLCLREFWHRWPLVLLRPPQRNALARPRRFPRSFQNLANHHVHRERRTSAHLHQDASRGSKPIATVVTPFQTAQPFIIDPPHHHRYAGIRAELLDGSLYLDLVHDGAVL